MLALSRGSLKKRIVPQLLSKVPPAKYKTTKEKQCNLIKTFPKRFQDRRSQINKISTPSEDDSNNKFNKFFSEFKSMMMEDSDDSSA